MPERREVRVEPAVLDVDREPRDGADHEQGGPEQGRGRVAEGESADARQVARGRDDARRQAGAAGGEGVSRHALSRRAPGMRCEALASRFRARAFSIPTAEQKIQESIEAVATIEWLFGGNSDP
ncbi:protein of unknown function [Burkholderia multivorans]